MKRIIAKFAAFILLPGCTATGAGNGSALLDFDELAAAISVTREPADTPDQPETVTAALAR